MGLKPFPAWKHLRGVGCIPSCPRRRGVDRGRAVRRGGGRRRGAHVRRPHPPQQEDEEDHADPEQSQDPGPEALPHFQNSPQLLCSRGIVGFRAFGYSVVWFRRCEWVIFLASMERI